MKKKQFMTNFLYKHQTIVGLFDSDGTVGVRILKKKDNRLGFTTTLSFKQTARNIDLLIPIAKELKCNTLYTYGDDSRLDVNLNTESGQKLLNILHKHPPFSPGKRKDYLIALKIHRLAQQLIAPKPYGLPDKNKIVSIAMVFITYHMVNQTKTGANTAKRKETIDHWFNHLDSTDMELQEGLTLGQEWLNTIEQEVEYLRKYLSNKLISNGCVVKCKLPPAYIVGFFLGDGSLYISLSLPKPYHSLELTPYFTITEAASGKELLYGFQSTWNVGSVCRASASESVFRYKLTGWDNCLNTIIPILFKYQLPKARQKQFNIFHKTCIMGQKAEYRTRNGFNRIVETFWEMTDGGLTRKETKSEVFQHAQIFFDRKDQNPNKKVFRNSLHIALRKKYVTSKGNIRRKEQRQKVKPIPLYANSD